MSTLYLVCLAIGGTALVFQFVMSLIGFGGDSDVDAGHEAELAGDSPDHVDAAHHAETDAAHSGTWFAGMLSLRALTAALCFFGVGGLAATAAGWDSPLPLVAAAGLGFAAMYAVARIMLWVHSLQADGTVRIDNALNRPATVYLTIPAAKAGAGKVNVAVQNRTMEYFAVTGGAEPLQTGAKVKIVAIAGPRTVEVIAADQPIPANQGA